MRVNHGLWIIIVAMPSAAAAEPVPRITPGTYSASYSCGGGRAVPVEFYVLNDSMDNGYKFDKNRYQRVRVEVADAVFVASVIINGMGDVRIIKQVEEKRPSGGWLSIADTFDLAGRSESMTGTAWLNGLKCTLRPRANPNQRSAASMSHASTPEIVRVDHSLHRGGVPANYASFRPSTGEDKALRDAVARTIAADAQSWLGHRLKPNSVSDFHYFNLPGSPSSLFVWAGYDYVALDGWDQRGWAAVSVRNGAIECIRYHNKASCTRPRQGTAAQIAGLGRGKPRLGPIAVAASCFRTVTRYESRSREKVIYADRRGNVDTRTEYYSVPVSETVYQCGSQSYAVECVAQGTERLAEWMIGSGATRDHSFSLRSGQTTTLSAKAIADYNQRLRAGTCVRTR